MNLLLGSSFLTLGKASSARIGWLCSEILGHYQTKNQEIKLKKIGLKTDFKKSARTIIQAISRKEKELVIRPSLVSMLTT